MLNPNKLCLKSVSDKMWLKKFDRKSVTDEVWQKKGTDKIWLTKFNRQSGTVEVGHTKCEMQLDALDWQLSAPVMLQADCDIRHF